ncbi:DUF6301 family protein [Actinoplanes sp. NPDC026670]|uniref:DUF6301 family protein n=1 Tax=Actinoplanes sp. NPDC026670 TaxID=3154700 RepID=UPI0034099B6E
MYALARTVAAVAGIGWAWTADELEGLVTAAGWIYRAPSEGTVSCTFDAAPGRAGAFLFGAEVTAVFLNLHEWDDDLHERDDLRVPVRRDGFVAAIAEVGAQLGPPVMRCPGPDPSVGWRVAAGVLEIVDRPGVLDLWLRPAPRRVPHPPVQPVEEAVDWATLEAGLAAAAASLPAGARVRLAASTRKDADSEPRPRGDAGEGTRALVELSQTEDGLTVRVGDGTETIRWPATGETYRKIAEGLVTALRAGVANPAALVCRADLPVPYLPLRREIRRT